MFISNTFFKQSYRLLTILLSEWCLFTQFIFIKQANYIELFFYFPFMITVLVLCYFSYLLLCNPKKEKLFLKGSLLVSILIIIMSQSTLLPKQCIPIYNMMSLLTCGEYLLFTKKGNIHWFHPFTWMLLPLSYGIAVFLRPTFSNLTFRNTDGISNYPFSFLDIDQNGIGKVIFYILLILFIYIIIGYILFGLDHLIKPKKRKNKKR